MDRYGVQINKTSRNTVLFMTTIGTTRSSVAYLIEVLVTIARELETQLADMSPNERAAHERAVQRLTAPSAPLPDFSGFHPSFTDGHGVPTPEGDVRRAFYLSYNDSYCEYLTPDEVEQRVENGDQVVSTTYVTPYPPGYPVLVPGQVFSREILSFMRSLDTPEIHGYRADLGYRVYLDKALEIAATTRPAPRPDQLNRLEQPAAGAAGSVKLHHVRAKGSPRRAVRTVIAAASASHIIAKPQVGTPHIRAKTPAARRPAGGGSVRWPSRRNCRPDPARGPGHRRRPGRTLRPVWTAGRRLTGPARDLYAIAACPARRART